MEGITANDTYTLYLPLVLKEEPPTPLPPSISGTVTYSGTRIAGIPLSLEFSANGTTFTTYSTTTTLSNGTYRFSSLPDLQSGQRYYVRYVNQTNSSHLSAWYTRAITENFTGEVNIGDFDIANVALNSPPHSYSGPLPITFQWTRRNATPSDSYFFQLFNPANYNPRFLSDPLGNVNTYTLTGLPANFQTRVQYGWNAGIKSPDNGTGYSFSYRAITFTP